MRRWEVLLVLILLLVHCKEKETWKGEIKTEGGVVTVINRGEGLWAKKLVKFNEDLSIGLEEGPKDYVFYGPISIAVDSELAIYVSDHRKYRLCKFDREGKLIWCTGRKGQGPGEFTYPGEVYITPEGKIVVGDDPRKLHFYTKEGKFIETIEIEVSPSNLQFLEDGRILVNAPVWGQVGRRLLFLSSEGKIIEEFPIKYIYGPKLPPQVSASTGGKFRLINEKIYFTLPDRYEIRVYNLGGKLERKIIRDVKFSPPNIQVLPNGVRVFPSDGSKNILSYRDKFLLNVWAKARKAGRDYKVENFMDLFTMEGKYLTTIKLPPHSSAAACDHLGNVYLIISEPFPQVKRYTLKLGSDLHI